MLGNYSLMERSTQHAMEINPNGNEAETAYLPDVAHVILLFVEKLIEKLRTAKVCFEKNPVRSSIMCFSLAHSPNLTSLLH